MVFNWNYKVYWMQVSFELRTLFLYFVLLVISKDKLVIAANAQYSTTVQQSQKQQHLQQQQQQQQVASGVMKPQSVTETKKYAFMLDKQQATKKPAVVQSQQQVLRKPAVNGKLRETAMLLINLY